MIGLLQRHFFAFACCFFPPPAPSLSCLAPAPLCFAPPSSPFWLCRPVVVSTPLVVSCGSPRRHPVHGSSPLSLFLSSSFLHIYSTQLWWGHEQSSVHAHSWVFFTKEFFTHPSSGRGVPQLLSSTSLCTGPGGDILLTDVRCHGYCGIPQNM